MTVYMVKDERTSDGGVKNVDAWNPNISDRPPNPDDPVGSGWEFKLS